MSKPVVSIASYLETLQDTKFSTKSHTMGLMGLNVVLQEKDSDVSPQEVQRILAVIEKCMKEDIMLIPHALTANLSLLTNVKVIQNLPTQDLLPSALAVLNMLQTMCVFKVTENLRYMGMQVFLAYPTDVLSMIVKQHCAELIKIFEVFKPSNNQAYVLELNKSAYYILKRLLSILTPEEKKLFLEEGIPIWFSDFIPLVMSLCTLDSLHHLEYLELLETLTEALVAVDYFKHPQWKHEVLSSVCDSTKYPSLLKRQLLNNSTVWHRLWIVLAKLLKTQVTRSCAYGTPIQSMLGVVESGFKIDSHKVRAFQCWDNLIEILSTDTTPKCVPRYIKLLLIPMKVNNAKTEPTLQAKFHTWWKLIQKFQSKLDQFTDEVVITFIQFAFGKTETSKNSITITGAALYLNISHLCLQAFVQIVGHDENCNCCALLPKLSDKLLNKKLLLSHWEHWKCALKMAIIATNKLLNNAKDNVTDEPMQVLCIWRAFVMSIAELPPNGVRSDLFSELLQVLVDLVQFDGKADAFNSILFSVAISLTENNENIKDMLLNCKGDEQPLQKIIPIILQVESVYKRYKTKAMVEMLKPLTELIVESKITEWLVDYLTQHSKKNLAAVTLWASLSHSINETDTDIPLKLLSKILIWPISAMILLGFEVDDYSASVWLSLYSVYSTSLCLLGFDKHISALLWSEKNDENDLKSFKFVVIVSLLKHMLIDHQDIHEYSEKLENLTKSIHNYQACEPAFPMLVDTLVVMVNKVCSPKHINASTARVAINCVENVLKFINPPMNADIAKNVDITLMLKNISDAVKDMCKIPEYSHISCQFLDVEGVLSKINSLTHNISKALSKHSSKTNSDISKIKKDFTSPNIKEVKKSKKKEASIVKTFVENGEEYVVVKSNWKFNPKKLTENQKEKLQRKREDIPALYQDLSQSQDEFKLKTWKTDSQDTIISTSTSNSKSATENQKTNEDASNILKTIVSFDVVPNIMKNMITENDKNQTTNCNTTNVEPAAQTNKHNKVDSVTPKNTKSPRMALKDRVFRNVRNLIEKSSRKSSNSDVITVQCQISDVATPPPLPIEQNCRANLIQSAPNLISADRPSRLKRKPKKFDDVELFGLTKRRYSQTDSFPNTQIRSEISDCDIVDKVRRQSKDEKDNDTGKANLSIDNTGASIVKEITDVPRNNKDESDRNVQENEYLHTTENTTVYNTSALDKVIANEPLNDDHEKEAHAENNVQNNDNDIDMQNTEHKKSVKERTNRANDPNDNQQCDDAQNMETNETVQDKKDNDNSQNSQVENISEDQRESVIHDDKKKAENETTDDNNTQSNVEAKKNNKETDILKTPVRKIKVASQKSFSTSKKSTKRKSRLESELAIDMVEGHPFLKIQSERRLTRKKLIETENTGKRKNANEDKNKTKTSPKLDSLEKGNKKSKEKDKLSPNGSQSSSTTIEESQENNSPVEEAPCSEDVIESSQDSTFTTISVKSTKRTPKRVPVVSVEKIDDLSKHITGTQDLLQESECEVIHETNTSKTVNQDSRDDIELPQNKTAEVNKNISELTDNMDTETITDDVIIINDEESPITVSSENNIGQETQELAEADTQPNNPAVFAEFEPYKSTETPEISNTAMDITESMTPNKFSSQSISNTQESKKGLKKTRKSRPICRDINTDCSPFKDDDQRKQDFLNNTSEISPIKVQSPDKEKSSPDKQEETSSDYLIVKLSSPVHSNGEPYHSGSPEFFTEDKISPDKRDQSPPRNETSVSSGSPSSSLSLKKNRPQAMRPGGRAAHMLGLLCISDSLKHSERIEPEEPKKVSTSTPARRNLRVLYNTSNDNSDNLEEEEQVNFLKLKKTLPSIDSSPSVPILKRKLDVVDDNTASPAGKRKRVSFHDPPVSTTVSVQKYIEPALNKSPSSSLKRIITRNLTKSPKRLDSAFKLDTVLSKAVESFKEQTDSLTNDTNTSLDVTPAVEVVNTSELNDKDPICEDLVDCKDSIEHIALELSSPAMKDLLIKELDGKVLTVGDLAKMTELEVNRLCIKAPKVQVAKRVLAAYALRTVTAQDIHTTEDKHIDNETIIATEMDEEMNVPGTKSATIDTQTDNVPKCDVLVQTRPEIVKLASTQTYNVPNEDASVQTLESGSKTTTEIISSCLSERPDFIAKLGEILSADKLIAMVANQPDFKQVLGQLLDHRGQNVTSDERIAMELAFLKDFLSQRFGGRELIRFCSKMLESVYDKLD